MITPKENYLNVLLHKDPVWTPIRGYDMRSSGFSTFPIEKGPIGGGLDGFGVNWVCPISGGGAPIPEPGRFMFTADDMPEWHKYVRFPDLNDFDWRMYAEKMLAPGGQPLDRDQFALGFGIGNGPYERIASLIGFEETLLAIVEYPEETRSLVDAIVDWKIEQVKLAKKWISPDAITNYDDFCTQRSPFMSREQFREVFFDANARYYQAIRDEGIIPIQHTCGYAEPLVDLFIETGIDAWESVQPCNDVASLISEYGDKLTFVGGFDSVGRPALPEATPDEIVAEVHRCLDEYGGRKGYIFSGVRMLNTLDKEVQMKDRQFLTQAALDYSHAKAGVAA